MAADGQGSKTTPCSIPVMLSSDVNGARRMGPTDGALSIRDVRGRRALRQPREGSHVVRGRAVRAGVSALGIALLAAGLAPAAGGVEPIRPLADLGRTVWQEELPQLSVHAIAQTKDGYLWIATQQGLARFDGTRFTTFNSRNTEALRRNVIWGLLGSRAGGLWIGSMPGGLSLLENRTFSTFGLAHGLASGHVYVVHEDPQGRLWVGTTDGLALLTGDRFEQVAAVGRVPVRALGSRGDDLWIATEGAGLMRLSGERLERFGPEQGLVGQRLRALALAPDGRVFVGSDEGQLEQLEAAACARCPATEAPPERPYVRSCSIAPAASGSARSVPA